MNSLPKHACWKSHEELKSCNRFDYFTQHVLGGVSPFRIFGLLLGEEQYKGKAQTFVGIARNEVRIRGLPKNACGMVPD